LQPCCTTRLAQERTRTALLQSRQVDPLSPRGSRHLDLTALLARGETELHCHAFKGSMRPRMTDQERMRISLLAGELTIGSGISASSVWYSELFIPYVLYIFWTGFEGGRQGVVVRVGVGRLLHYLQSRPALRTSNSSPHSDILLQNRTERWHQSLRKLIQKSANIKSRPLRFSEHSQFRGETHG
jgi:hypothetical protein